MDSVSETPWSIRLFLAVVLSISSGTSIAGPSEYCTPASCPGLVSFENVDNMVETLLIEKNAARLAYSLGVSLARENCCFREAVGYLRFALSTSPELRRNFYEDMNRGPYDSNDLRTRLILAVSNQLR